MDSKHYHPEVRRENMFIPSFSINYIIFRDAEYWNIHWEMVEYIFDVGGYNAHTTPVSLNGRTNMSDINTVNMVGSSDTNRMEG